MIGMLGEYNAVLPPVFETDYMGPVRNWRDGRNIFSRPRRSYESSLGMVMPSGGAISLGIGILIIGGLGLLAVLAFDPAKKRGK